ncbi:MAG: hypothetical protein ABEI99_06660 [Halobaculum sp.]
MVYATVFTISATTTYVEVVPATDVPARKYLLAGLYTVVTGGLFGLAWHWRLRATAVVGLIVTVALTRLLPSSLPRPSHAATVFAVTVMVFLIEADRRYPERTSELFEGAVGVRATAAGLGHFAVGFILQMLTRGFSLFSGLDGWTVLVWGVYVVSSVGLAAMGALSVLLWDRERLVSPSLVTLGYLSHGVARIWQNWESLPITRATAVAWIDPTATVEYLFQWTPALASLLFLAAVEWAARSSYPSTTV